MWRTWGTSSSSLPEISKQYRPGKVLSLKIIVLQHSKYLKINTRNDEVDTYNHLLQKSISTAKALQKRGFKRQHLVALCCDRENINASIPLIAAQFLGCISYSIDPDSSVGDCAELLRQAQPKIIFFIGLSI